MRTNPETVRRMEGIERINRNLTIRQKSILMKYNLQIFPRQQTFLKTERTFVCSDYEEDFEADDEADENSKAKQIQAPSRSSDTEQQRKEKYASDSEDDDDDGDGEQSMTKQ